MTDMPIEAFEGSFDKPKRRFNITKDKWEVWLNWDCILCGTKNYGNYKDEKTAVCKYCGSSYKDGGGI